MNGGRRRRYRIRRVLPALALLLPGAACTGGTASSGAAEVTEVDWRATTYPAGTCGYQRPVPVRQGRAGERPEATGLDYSESSTPLVEVEQVDVAELLPGASPEVVVTLVCAGHEWEHREVLVFGDATGAATPALRIDRMPCAKDGWSCGAVGDLLAPPQVDDGELVLRLRWVDRDGDLQPWGAELTARFSLTAEALQFVGAALEPFTPNEEVSADPARALLLGLAEGWDVRAVAPPEVLSLLQRTRIATGTFAWRGPTLAPDGTGSMLLQQTGPLEEPAVAVVLTVDEPAGVVTGARVVEPIDPELLHG